MYMRHLPNLFENNRKWSQNIKEKDQNFFSELSKQQNPEYLWIGCSDSRVPANEIVGLMPGELFVHRNVSNMVIHTDMNCLSVIQFAVEALNVKHIIVCGHYGCGGVKASVEDKNHGLIDNWLRHIKDIYYKHKNELDKFNTEHDMINRLCELNVIEQVKNVCSTTIVKEAWKNDKKLSIHGWIYGLHDGLLKDLDICISNLEEFNQLPL